jgi:hypothetical protein
MQELYPYERCPLTVGILIQGQVRFYKFAPDQPTGSFVDFTNPSEYHNVSPEVNALADSDEESFMYDPMYYALDDFM